MADQEQVKVKKPSHVSHELQVQPEPRVRAKIPRQLSEKCVLVIWIACFGVLIILSFFIFVPVAVTMENAGNNCFLYSDSRGFGEYSVCSYCVASAVCFLCLCGLRLIVLVIKIMRYSSSISDRIYECFSVWGVHMTIFILDLLMVILLLVTAALISAGLARICELFQDKVSCSSSYGVELPNGEVDTTFYHALRFSEISAWFTFCFWLAVVGVEAYIGWKKGSFKELKNRIKNLIEKKPTTMNDPSLPKGEILPPAIKTPDMTKY
uniref:Uncharacterized protein n=1 Tax=Biomphalaria glabrata TaxID=6526 RepID=A0A2C9L6C0_BIOGL